MNKPSRVVMPKPIKGAVFIVFSLLTVAVVAGQAHSSDATRYETAGQAAEFRVPTDRQSLIVSRVGKFGARLVQSWLH